MALVLNEEQKMLQKSAEDFATGTVPVSHFRDLRDRNDELGFDRDVWQQMCDMGWSGITIDEKYDGLAFGWQGLGLVIESLGKQLTPSPLLATVALGADLVQMLGTEEQKQSILPKVVTGEMLLALALDEGYHHNPDKIECVAEKSGDGWELHGRKVMVTDGHAADKIIVAARTKDTTDGVSLFLVDKGNANLQVSASRLADSKPVAQLALEGVKVEQGQLLGTLNEGKEALHKVLDRGRVALAAEMLGMATQAFKMTVEWLKEREQFGVPIGSFQALQHRASHMFSELEIGRAVVYEALSAIESNDESLPKLASLAKAKLGDILFLVSNEAVQMHGGIGVTDEHDIGFYLKRARVAEATLGDRRYHRTRFADLSAY